MASAEDVRLFPNASDVIRFGSERWSTHHDHLLHALAEVAREQCQGARSAAEIPKMLSPPPRIQFGEQYVYLLLAPDYVRLDDPQQPSLDIREL